MRSPATGSESAKTGEAPVHVRQWWEENCEDSCRLQTKQPVRKEISGVTVSKPKRRSDTDSEAVSLHTARMRAQYSKIPDFGESCHLRLQRCLLAGPPAEFPVWHPMAKAEGVTEPFHVPGLNAQDAPSADQQRTQDGHGVRNVAKKPPTEQA